MIKMKDFVPVEILNKMKKFEWNDLVIKVNKNGTMIIKDKFNDLMIGTIDGMRFETLKNAIDYMLRWEKKHE